jgi:hypothetical protein
MTGNNHGRETGSMLHENMGTIFHAVGILSQMVPLKRFLRTWESLVKALPRNIILL